MNSQRATLRSDDMLARLGGTPDIYIHNFDPVRDALLLVEWSAQGYREASFLDDRVMSPGIRGGWVRRERVAPALVNPACARPLHFIFHTGHVGSTLISRLLESVHPVLSLREPIALRTLADLHDVAQAPDALLSSEMVSALQQQLLHAWSRGYADTDAVVLKATSSAGRIASSLLDLLPDARAIYVNLGPEPFLATLLGGANSWLDLRGHGPARIRRLNARLASMVGPLHALSAGEMAALAWAVETLAQHDARATCPTRVLSVDFDEFLRDVPAALSAVSDHLGLSHGLPIDTRAVEAELQRYSKAPEQPYSPTLRAERLAEARRQHQGELRRGLDWLDALARSETAIAALFAGRQSA